MNVKQKKFILVKVTRILRPTVSRAVRLGVRHPSGTRDHSFSLKFSLDRCGFVIL
jgi:hypothetical protein